MPQVPYVHFPAITVNDSRPFHTKVTALLDTIRSLPLGNSMMQAIQNSRKSVGIAPFRPEDSGNKCVAHNYKKFVRLRQALEGLGPGSVPAVSVSEELTYTLDQAEKMGQGRMFIAKQLIRGLTPATVRAVNNVVHPARALDRQTETDQAWAMAQLIEKLGNGQIKANAIPTAAPNQYGIKDQLVRILKPWLRSGDGSNSGVYFDPDKDVSCSGSQGELAWRPPGIGLAHELCHVWRNATGNRLFDDAQACGLDDDEVMTTGIPPYNFEEYTENKFRQIWPLTSWEKWRHWTNELPMRTAYR
jgi:hypothetical protein